MVLRGGGGGEPSLPRPPGRSRFPGAELAGEKPGREGGQSGQTRPAVPKGTGAASPWWGAGPPAAGGPDGPGRGEDSSGRRVCGQCLGSAKKCTLTCALNNKTHFSAEGNGNRFTGKNVFSLYYNIKQITHQHNPGDTRKGSSKKLTLLFINLRGLREGKR